MLPDCLFGSGTYRVQYEAIIQADSGETLKCQGRWLKSKYVGGVAAATPPNQPQRCILTDDFNNYNFSKLQ